MKLKTPIELETAFNRYTLTEQLGEGGAGRVYGGVDTAGSDIAIKVLTSNSVEKRRRFKNEIGFLTRNRHANVVTVLDHGLATTGSVKGAFYVLPRYASSLRPLMGSMSPDQAMEVFSKILDGVEAAHMQEAIHRDLKPENILVDTNLAAVAVADFGIASFATDDLATLVETLPTTRLANFQYAAPEQRLPGRPVSRASDIYALGLILNELFTGSVPHGTEYQSIGSVTASYAFLDAIVASMIRQNSAERPPSILDVKQLIQSHKAEAVALQKLRELDRVVVPAGEITNPLAFQAPRLVGAEYDRGTLILTLDRPIDREWVTALQDMGSYSSVMGVPPQAFNFSGSRATVAVREHAAQAVIDTFKQWLPTATNVLKHNLEQQAQREENLRIQQLKQEREMEERRLALNRSLRI